MNLDLFRVEKWMSQLQSDEVLQQDLSETFLQSGIRDEYLDVEEAKGPRFIKDLVWGNIVTSNDLFSVIDSPFFQRQRLITKLGFSSLTYPGATHTLLEHSLGCLNLIQTILNKPVDLKYGTPKYELSDNSLPVALENLLYQHAALLHDVGLPVYGIFTSSLLLNPQNSCFHSAMFGRSSLKALIETAKKFLDLVRPDWLSEESFNLKIISCILLLSKKFSNFYDHLSCFRTKDNTLPFSPSVMLAGCILGVSINGNTNLFWDIYHGPFGAKTIDELIRDTKNCGVNSPIDHQRMIASANLIYIPKEQTDSDNYDSDGPLLRAYIIDQFDSYVFRELKMSIELIRSRIYSNSWRKAFKDLYHTMLLSATPGDKTTFINSNGQFDYLMFWRIFEESLLDECKRNSDKQTSLIASRIIFRQSPKRCLSIEPQALEVKGIEFIKDTNKYHYKQFLKINQIMAERIFEYFEVENLKETFIQQAKAEISKALFLSEYKTKSPESIELYACIDNSYYDHDVTSIGFKKGDKQRYYRDELFQIDHTPVQATKIFFYTTEELSEVAYLVLKKMLYERFHIDTASVKTVNIENAGNEKRDFYIRPHISDNHACTVCDLDPKKLQQIENRLADRNYYDDCPCICETTGEHRAMARKISPKLEHFQGEEGYTVSSNSIEAFIQQFPPKFRHDALTMVNTITLLNRDVLTENLKNHIEILRKKYENVFLVPLSESSGKTMKSALSNLPEKIYNTKSLTEALTTPLRKVGKKSYAILIYDDNLISGTQAEAQVRFWNENLLGKEHSNLNITPLPSSKRAVLRKSNLYFSFVVTWEKGRDRVDAYLNHHGFKVNKDRFMYKYNIEELSEKLKVSQGFKEYLRKIGETTYSQKMKADQKSDEEILQTAPLRAMGFDNLEGLYVTYFNVPTATITALWCPGLVQCGDVTFPWKPLFIRTNSLKNFIW